MKPGQPWLFDSATGDIVGVKDSDGGETLFAAWNPAATALVHPMTGAGMQFIQTNLIGYDTTNPPSDLDWMSIRSTNEWSDLVVVSPYSPGHVLHPSLCHVKSGFAGYRYWMAYTPYPDSDNSFENPCIAASNDLVNWSYPSTNPIIPDPGGTYYNSDTDMYFDEAGQRLVMLWRDVTGATAQLKIVTSVDGVTWSAPTTIYTAANPATSTATDIASPSIWYNSATSKWEIIGFNVKDNASAWSVVKITSSALLSGWDTSASWTVITMTPPAGRKWWHGQFRRLSGGAIVGLVQDNPGTVGTSGDLYSVYSADGVTFASRLIDTQAIKGWYRPTFTLMHDPVSKKVAVFVLGSKLTEARLFQQVMQFDLESFALARAGSTSAILSGAALGNVQGILHADTFNRADDATGLGTSTSGHTYTQTSAAPTVIGISGNRAYPVDTAGNCQAYRGIGTPNCIMRVTIAEKTSGEMWLLARFTDNSNKIRIGCTSGSQLTYQVITGGSFAINEQLGITPAVGDEIQASFLGNQIKIYLNGKLVAKRISNQGVTSENFGLAMSGTATKADNLVIVGANS